jgi:uncharacterized protein (TIGR01244 family)
MRFRFSSVGAAAVLVLALTTSGLAQDNAVTRPTVAGVRNFAQVETTVACGGATQPESLAEIKRLGFASVINLRLSTENGANIDAEAAAAKVAGLNFVHVPFSGSSPDPAAVVTFLAAVTDKANQPAFIHCASGNRAAAMWMIKRALVDGWSLDRASAEATSLGLTSSSLEQFVTSYIESHQKQDR